ncbi:MAG: hypothetical protein JXA09_02040 [Anaerolineae bacterium]|nr:hypothetical protein [Anaerolineae bacterium]
MVDAAGGANRANDGAFSARRIVDLLAGVARGDEPTGDADALVLAQEVQAALMAALEGNLGHVVLWEQFLRTPDEVADALVGVVEAVMRRDAALAEWLREAWARWRQAQAGG